MSSIFLALPPSAKSQKNMGRTLVCGHFSKSGTTNFFFGGGGWQWQQVWEGKYMYSSFYKIRSLCVF